MGRKRRQTLSDDTNEINGDLDATITVKEEFCESDVSLEKPKKKKKKHLNKEITEVDESDIQVVAELNVKEDTIDWESEDLTMLIDNIQKELPKNDTFKYSTTLEKIDWDKIKFKYHTADDCKCCALKIMRKLRGYRTLSEMLVDAHNYALNPYKSLSTGRIKHPDKPKKPMTPCLRFFSEKRLKYQALYPDASITELSKICANKYANLSEKKKNKYKRLYDSEMLEYKKNCELFRLEHPEVFKNAPRARTSDKREGPEKPRTPYQFFVENKMKKFPDDSKKDALEKIRELWNNVSEKKRIKFIRKALKDQTRYEEEITQYLKENPEFEPPTLRPLLTKSEIELKYKYEGRPQKPPISGYILFSKLMLKEFKDVPSREKMVIIAKRWKEMSEEERNDYNDQAQKSLTKYISKFDAYLQQLPEEEKEKVLAESKLKLPNEKKIKSQSQNNSVLEHTAFMAYQIEQLQKMENLYPTKSKSHLFEMINTKWKELSESDKSKYIQAAESVKDFMPKPEKETKSKKSPIEVEFTLKSGLKRPPKNGFSLYYTQMSHRRDTSVAPKELMHLASVKWKEMSEVLRNSYVKLAKDRNQTFNQLFEEYKKNGTLPDESVVQSLNSNHDSINEAETSNVPKAEDKTKLSKNKKPIPYPTDNGPTKDVSKFLYDSSDYEST